MDQNKLITVYIPVYNDEKYIFNAVNSVLNQTEKSFNLYVINDGSQDNTLQILDSFRGDRRFFIMNDGLNKGLISRLNESIDSCVTKYYARMDSDDIMMPDRLERQLNFLEKNPKIEVVHSAAVSINSKDEILGIRNNFSETTLNIVHPTVFAKTTFLKQHKYRKGFELLEDLELWKRTYDKSRFNFMTEPTLFYRENNKKVSTKHKKMYNGLKNIVKEYSDNRIESIKTLGLSKLKYLTYLITELVNMDSFLLKGRYNNLSQEDILKSAQILQESLKKHNGI